MACFADTYHRRAVPDDHCGVRDLARDARETLRRNDREGWAWHYGLPVASAYTDAHPDWRRSYTRAVNTDYAALCRWLAARGYPVTEGR